jgi:hypothetical protein
MAIRVKLLGHPVRTGQTRRAHVIQPKAGCLFTPPIPLWQTGHVPAKHHIMKGSA